MKIALISDVHGNAVALEAVLTALAADAPDRVVCLGDVALLGPAPAACIDRLAESDVPVVQGNTDAWLLDPTFEQPTSRRQAQLDDVGRWCLDRLDAPQRAALEDYVPTVRVELPGGDLLCFHGSPRSFHEVIKATTPTPDLMAALGGKSATFFAGGHTHEALVRPFAGAMLINPGSVGLPVVRRGEAAWNPGWAEYAVLSCDDAAAASVDLKRVPVDVEAVRVALETSGMPHGAEWAQEWQPADWVLREAGR